MRRSLGHFLLPAIVACAACGGSGASVSKDGARVAKPPGQLGDACTAREGSMQGSCADGLLCAPLPGGTCTTMCPCGEGAACVDSPRAGELCLKSCERDDDCRDGYACDEQWKTCSVAGFLAPKAPVCSPPAASLPRKTFGKVEALSGAGSPGSYQTETTAALTADGTLVVAFIAAAARGEPNTLAVATVSPKGTVEPARELRFDTENHFDPWLEVDRKGKLYLAWLGFDGGRAPEKNMRVGVATSDDGREWSAPVAAHDAGADCGGGEAPGCLDKPMLAIGPDRSEPKRDAVYAFYYANMDGALKVARSTDGGASFSPSARVGGGAYADAAVTASGKIHVAYLAASEDASPLGDAKNAIEYASSSDGGASFSEPVRVSGEDEPAPLYFASPQIIADVKNAVLYAAYTAGTPDGRWNVALASSLDGGQTWSRTPINDDASGACASHMAPAVALDPATGRVHVTWLENRTGEGGLAYASCVTDKKGTRCSANEAVNDAPFADYGLVRHSPRWLGDYNALLIDAKRKTMHAVWTQVIDEGGEKVARVMHAAGKLK